MIKLKKQQPKKQRTSFFLYKNIDYEFNINVKSHWFLRYYKVDGEHRFVKYFGDSDRTVTIAEHLQTPSFAENLISFFMFKINSIRFDVHNLVVRPADRDLELLYYLCFFPTTDFGVINPFVVINNPRALTITTKQPFAFQEIVFPKTYLKGVDMQGFGVWMSSDYNSLFHDIPACVQVANAFISFPSDFLLASVTITTNVSFRQPR